MNNKTLILIISAAIIILAGFGFTKEAEAAGAKTIFYMSTASHAGGNFGGRSGADTFCSNNKPVGLTTATNIHALLCVSAADEVQDMPSVYGYSSGNPLYWYNTNTSAITQFASSWSDFLDGTISVSPSSGTGVNESYWSGCQQNGSVLWTCSGWTSSNTWGGVCDRDTTTIGDQGATTCGFYLRALNQNPTAACKSAGPYCDYSNYCESAICNYTYRPLCVAEYNYPGWLAGYNYKQRITINHTDDGAQTYYQLALTVNKTTGTSSDNVCYLQNHALSWTGTVPNDIRFTRLDGVTELDYWIESSDANTAKVWIEFNSIPAHPDNGTFYIYYGKASDNTTSNGDNTFILFDDFNDGTIDTGKWELVGTPTESGGTLNETIGNYIQSNSSFGLGTRFRSKVKYEGSNRVCASGFYEATNWYGSFWYTALPWNGNIFMFLKRYTAGQIYPNVGTFDTNYHIPQIDRYSSTKLSLYDDTTLKNTETNTGYIAPGSLKIQFLTSEWGIGGDCVITVDWVFVGKVTTNEPTWGTWGSEEAPAYYTSGNFISTNLLLGVSPAPTSINSFVYNLSAKPANTTATVGFNQNGGSTWYNAAGNVGTETLVTGSNQTITLISGWSGANFYYKVIFGSTDGVGTPVLDDITVNYTSNAAPTAPTSLLSEGATNPTNVTDLTPEFSAIYNDPDTGDIANKYRVEVNTASNFTGTVMWDSGAAGTAMTNCTQGNRCQDISYAGTALSLNGTIYYWRIRFWDDSGAEGAVSTESASFTMKQGVLEITSPSSATLTGKTVSVSAQASAGVIGDSNHTNAVGVKVADDRPSSPGWTATIAVTHFTTRATQKTLAGSNNTVTFSGTYDGLDGVKDPNGTFKVEITTGGAVGTAVFKWWDPAGNLTSTVTTAATVVLSNGISVNFATATYVVGDRWSAGVDVFPYTGLTVTPSDIYNESGSLVGVSKGSSEALTGTGATSNAKTLMTATAGNGTGIYWQDEDLSLSIHANSLFGDFTATATLTAS